MCGRSRCTLAPERVLQVAGASRWVDRERYQPSHNLAPGGWSPVVVAAAAAAAAAPAGGAAAAAAPEHEVRTMRWGLVPSYTKPSDKPDPWRLFNARSETAAETPAFRRLVPSRRCLVLLDGFYEWNKERAVGGGSGKQPYYVHLEGGGPMVAAGLYDVWAVRLQRTAPCPGGPCSVCALCERFVSACICGGGALTPPAPPLSPLPPAAIRRAPTGRCRPTPYSLVTRRLGWSGCTTACPCCCTTRRHSGCGSAPPTRALL
jgi:putative SOS response-associated peptidase YedK